ncbi:MAG: hypothetical protein EBR82_75750 [Caulobacteraceae bacterium]|nr:hypothetical protein [Caulobacteraceae bacterium]
MGYIKAFIMDNQGAGWKSFDELTADELAELENAINTQESNIACVICFKPIPQGTGNTCDTHKGQQPNW